MSCLDENQVLELLEGRLSAEARAAADAHLAECGSCRRLIAGAAPPGAVSDTLPGGKDPAPREAATRRPGALIARYVILRVVGTGGMGVVYAAHDPELDRKVAIKLLRKFSPDGDDERQARLLREAQAMARLTHPNVVAVHDVGVAGGQVFIVMELIAGTTLSRWLRDRARSPQQVLAVFRRAGQGLAAAHAVGLVHRDVKPDNVLIADDGRVLVTDFGLARSASEPSSPDAAPVETSRLTQSGAFVGTPAYMSPEQIDGADATLRSDVFSFCVALYEALYRQRPFAGDTLSEVRGAISRGELREPPRGVRVPAWVRRVLARGLDADPARRHASMKELLAALGRDPAAALRRVALVAGAVLLVGGAIALGYGRSSARARLCGGGGERFDRVIAPARLAALRAPAIAGGTPNDREAAARRARLVDGLVDYRRDWVQLYQDACEATHARGDQSAELLDLRMSCLDTRLAGAEEVATLLERKSSAVDERLASARALEPLASCSDREELLAPTRPPRDPALRAQVDELRKQRARAGALDAAGDYGAALALAKIVAERGRALGYQPLAAEAALELGVAEGNESAYAESQRDFEDAIFIGEATHLDRVVAIARLDLANLAWMINSKDARRFTREAEAAIARVGHDVDLESRLLDTKADLEEGEGHHAEAEALLLRRIELLRGATGVDPLLLGYAENNLGNFLLDKRPSEAMAHFDRALAIEAPVVGPHHPQMLLLKFNRAIAASSSRTPREQIAVAEELLADVETAVVPDHVYHSRVLTLYSNALFSDPERRAESPAVQQRALAVLLSKLAADHPLVIQAKAQLAEMLFENGRAAEAETYARTFVELSEPVPDADHAMLRQALRLHAQTLLALDRAKEARADLERMVALRTPAGEQFPRRVALENYVLADAYERTGEHARAVALARKAEAGFLAAPIGDDERLARVRAWLAAHAR